MMRVAQLSTFNAQPIFQTEDITRSGRFARSLKALPRSERDCGAGLWRNGDKRSSNAAATISAHRTPDSKRSLAVGRRKVITDNLPSVLDQTVEGLLRFLSDTSSRTPEIPLVNREAPPYFQLLKLTDGRQTLPPAQ